jgi:hypothetical protein
LARCCNVPAQVPRSVSTAMTAASEPAGTPAPPASRRAAPGCAAARCRRPGRDGPPPHRRPHSGAGSSRKKVQERLDAAGGRPDANDEGIAVRLGRCVPFSHFLFSSMYGRCGIGDRGTNPIPLLSWQAPTAYSFRSRSGPSGDSSRANPGSRSDNQVGP